MLKIQKLEKLCRALQDERVILYDKIKEVRHASSNLPSKVLAISKPDDTPDAEAAYKSAILTPVEFQEIQEEDPVLTEDMNRLREEQNKLQEFAASLLATPSDDDEEEKNKVDLEEDVVASAFVQFKTKTQIKKEAVSVPEQTAESVEEVSKPDVSPAEAPTPVENTSAMTPAQAEVKVQTHVDDKEVQEIQQPPVEPVPTPEEVQIEPPADLKPEAPADLKPEAAEAEILVEASEVKPVIPVEEEKVQAEPVQGPEEAPTTSESAPSSENSPKTAASSSSDSSQKQTPKKKKKRNIKNAS